MYLHLKWLPQTVLHTVWRGMQISVGTYNCALKRNLTARRKKSGGSEKVLSSYLRKVHFPTGEVTFLCSLALWARPQLREGKFFEWGLSEVFKQYSWAPLYGHPFNMDTLFFFSIIHDLPTSFNGKRMTGFTKPSSSHQSPFPNLFILVEKYIYTWKSLTNELELSNQNYTKIWA